MDILHWLQLSEIKTGILNVAESLTDRMVDREQQTAKLVELSKKIHELENICLSNKGS